MNKELKVMISTAISLLVVLLVCDNLIHLRSRSYLANKTYDSQTVALNKLRHPNINRSSERGKYPSLKEKGINLVAVRKNNLLYVTRHQRVIYIAYALINSKPQQLTVNSARGEHNVHINSHSQSSAINWISVGRLGYIESPMIVGNHKVHHNWLKNKYQISNTIEVSRKDAKWLQQLPKGTTVTIK